MKTLFISFDNQYPLHTEGNIVVLKYDLLNDLLYEIGAELVFKSNAELTSDKTGLLTAFKNDRPSEFEEFSSEIMKTVMKEIFQNDINQTTTIDINLPDSYIEWLKYHTDPEYNKIGAILSSSQDFTITLQMEDLWDYLTNFLNTEVKGAINSDNQIQKFTFAETNNEKAKCASMLTSFRKNLSYEVYDGSWVLCELGSAFFNGIGAKKNIFQAVQFYYKAVEKGNKVAANWLGWCYQTGNEIDKDDVKAFEFYCKGSKLGNSNSDANLGYCYQIGIGTAVDYPKAVEHYTKGAEANITFAQYNLANIYYDGFLGVPDYDNAFKWYSEVAKNNDQLQAKFKVGMMLLEGKGTQKDEKRAFDYFLSASEGGLKEAHYQRGKLTEDGFGSGFSETKDEDAIDAYRVGMEAGDAQCAWAIVNIIKRNGFIRTKGIDALIWLKQQGDPNGIYELASYILDWGKKDDRRLSKYNVDKLMTEASKKGSSDAKQYLKVQSDKEIEAKRKLEEQRTAIERTRLEEEKKKEEEERIKKEKIRAENKLAEDFLRLHNQTIEAIHLYWGKNGKSDHNEAIKLLIEPARKKLPLAKAYLGSLLLKQNHKTKEALELLKSSIVCDQSIAKEYERISSIAKAKTHPEELNDSIDVTKLTPIQLGDYLCKQNELLERIDHEEIRKNTSIMLHYSSWAKCFGIHGDCYALLAKIYMDGIVVPKNINKAVDHIVKSIAEKSAYPNNFLQSTLGHYLYAICRYNGTGMIIDEKDALAHLKEATYDHRLTSKYIPIPSPDLPIAVPSAILTLSRINDDKNLMRKAAERTDAKACYEYAESLYWEDKNAEAEKWYNAAILNSNGNPEIIKKVQTRLREIGGRITAYTPQKMIEVYFDEIGPTLEKPKSVRGDKSSDAVPPIPQNEGKKISTKKATSSKAKAITPSSTKGKSQTTKAKVHKEEKAKESIFSKIRKLFQ